MTVKQALLVRLESTDSVLVWNKWKVFSISCDEQQHHSSELSARPLGQAYLSWPAGPGCGVYEAWCLWACWWCTCLPSQLSHVGASLLANRSPHQLADLQLINKVVRTWGSRLQRDRKHETDGVKEMFHNFYLLCHSCSLARWTLWRTDGCQVDGLEWSVGSHGSKRWQSYE